MKKMFRNSLAGSLIFALLFGLALVCVSTNQALAQTPQPTPLPSATPDADGRIYYIAQPGDSCVRISILTGVTVQTIRQLNNLTEACNIIEGQAILLGTALAAPEPTAALILPTPDPAQITPSPTPSNGVGKVCIVLFNDMNGNGTRDSFETHLYGGVASLNDRLGQVSLTGTTVAGDPDAASVTPFCFEDVPEGSYNVTIAIPDGFNPTTASSLGFDLKTGETATLAFGCQEATALPGSDQPAETGARSPLLGILGAVILLSGLGLGFYLWRQRRA